jgi:hypothetical protein
MTEAQLQGRVEALLSFYGWRWFHAPDNRPVTARSGRRYVQAVRPGFPDLIAVRRIEGHGPELLVAELKTDVGRYGTGQVEWLRDFTVFAVTVRRLVAGAPTGLAEEMGAPPAMGIYTWRPADLNSGAIEDVLAGPRGRNVLVALDD